MKTLKFKTNIKCPGCLSKVTPVLNDTDAISSWNVNILTPEKTLTVETETLKASEIIELIKQMGFTATAV